jgi:hypothetical protein
MPGGRAVFETKGSEAMNYLLVLQFPASSLEDYDAMIALEEAIIAELGEADKVDGHDMGSGESNIFVFTDDPKNVFAKLEPLLRVRHLLSCARIAYRDVDGDDYTILFPEELEGFSVA